jgi:membrane protein required for colicin V production
MNTLDIVLLLLFIPGIIRGISKGFLEQAIALVGIVFSVWAAFKFLTPACDLLRQYITIPDTILQVVAFLLILIVVSVVVLLLAKLLTKVVEMALLGWLNKALGLVSAILITAVVLGVLIILFDTVNGQFNLVKSDILETSVVYNLLKDFGYFIFPFLKQLIMPEAPAAAEV